MDTITDMLSTFFVSTKKVQRNVKSSQEVNPIDDTAQVIIQPDDRNNQDNHTQQSTTTFTDSVKDEPVKDEPIEEETFVRKYVMKANELARKDIVIVNKDVDENLTTLGDFLHMMSLMKNVQDTYSSSTYIITSNNNKSIFKQMLFENPYLHFTDFVVRTSMSKGQISDITSSRKRKILVVDTDIQAFDENTLQRYLDLKEENVQLVLLSTQYSNIAKFYSALGEHRLLIHRKERLKSMQRVFYKQIIKQICKDNIEFDTFFDVMNYDNFGVRYVIIKTDELRYN